MRLERELELGSSRSAWFMARRIREAMQREPLAGLVCGSVEPTEISATGKPRRLGRLSLYGLTVEEALRAMMQTGSHRKARMGAKN